VFPNGNNQNSSFLSIYLEFTEATFTPHIMCPKANFKLYLLNQKDPSLTIVKGTSPVLTRTPPTALLTHASLPNAGIPASLRPSPSRRHPLPPLQTPAISSPRTRPTGASPSSTAWPT
jgi:hypothetical protein